MQLRTIVNGPFRGNAYLIWPDGDSRAILIDPGDDPERLLKALETDGLTLSLMLATHGHLDHIGAAEPLRLETGAPVCVPAGDREIVALLPEACRLFGLPELPVPQVDHWLEPEEGQLAEARPQGLPEGLEIIVRPTPGHSPGGTCYQIGEHLFSGDTLFQGSVGRVDLPGGHWPTLEASLLRLLRLPDETVVHPGHGPATTIGRERKSNPFLLEIGRKEIIDA